MWNPRSPRSWLAATAAAATNLCATLAACSDDSATASATDAGLIDTMPGDGGKGDGDTGPPGNGPRITLVNAAHDLGATAAIRLCFKQGSLAQNLSIASSPPQPETRVPGSPAGPIGLYYGSGVSLATAGVDFAGRVVVPIVMSVRSLSARGLDDASTTCDRLFGDAVDASRGDRLRENTDFWVLPPIEVGALANGTTYVLALTGCVADAATLNPGKCGPGFVSGGDPGLGNLKLSIHEIAPAPPAAPLGAQFLYLSTQANAFFSQAAAKGAIQPGFVSNAEDGGGFRPITDISPPVGALSAIAQVTNVTEGDSFVFGPKSLNPTEAARGVPLLWSSLVAIQAYSGLGSGAGPPYPNGRSYVFIAVGDPDTGETKPFLKPDGTPGGDGGAGSRLNTRFFHVLAYPTP